MSKKVLAVDIDGTITLNGWGTIHLEALKKLRCLKDDGHKIILVTGRSSVEGYLLSIFGGLTHFAVGENGGCITYDDIMKHKIIGNKGADVVIDTTGNSRVIEQAYELTSSNGKTILVGVPQKGDNISIYSLPLHFNKVLTGSEGGSSIPDEDIPRYIRLMKSGKMTLEGIITEEFKLEEINKAIELFRSGSAGRVLINME